MDIPVPKYSIGQKVFKAWYRATNISQQCPDCLGTREWHVTTPAGEEFEIPCGTCSYAYSSTGYISEYKEIPTTEELTIGSVRINTSDEHVISYMCEETGVGSGTIHYEETLFSTEADAYNLAVSLAKNATETRESQNAEISKRNRKKYHSKPSLEAREIKRLKKELADLRKREALK